ncbi:MAG: hypothetical protein EBV69_04645 [Oxalobacteraceae bacterium]|jgi:hypothetical protein|nr:hypothetical protein [Oxalobacteraceae bacterium]
MKRELTIMDPAMTEEQAKVLLFLVRLSRQPNQRARAHAAIAMTWNRDPDFELIYPIIEFYWLAAIGYFELDKNFNPVRDQDRIVEFIIGRLAQRFPVS